MLGKANDGKSNGAMFSDRAGDSMQRIVLCSNWCASTGKPESTASNARARQGHVEYWKAQCGESRMLRLDGGKERKLLPIRTKH
jgi:hypothetical protein